VPMVVEQRGPLDGWPGAAAPACHDGCVAERRPKTLRDMALSMGLLAVVALVVVGLYGMVGFSPGRPAEGEAPTADVVGGFERAAPLVGFEVVYPVGVPASWHPNSFSFTEPSTKPDAPAAVRGGWLTPEGRFITLIESTGETTDVLRIELGAAAPSAGTQDVSGTMWTVTSGRRSEAAWFRIDGGVTFLITGSASAEDFATLARGVDRG
jgi:hypothetical protein